MPNSNSPLIVPGSFEIYVGCVQSGKSRKLIERLDQLRYVPNCQFLAFKPKIDTRDKGIKSRFGSLSLDCINIDESNPDEILDHLKLGIDVLAIDEISLFGPGIERVVEYSMINRYHVIAAGLDTDFRGEPFNQMPHLLSIATDVTKMGGVCRCGKVATRTQRLIDGKPAHYDSPLILIDGAGADYECRCINCHEVPGKPKIMNLEKHI